MKKFALMLLGLLVSASAMAQTKPACNIGGVNGRFCAGVVAAYNFEEAADSVRQNLAGFGSDLQECDTFDINRVTGNSMGFAAEFGTATSRGLILPYGGSGLGPGFWTIAVDVSLITIDAGHGDLILIDTQKFGNNSGIKFFLKWTGTVYQARLEGYQQFTDALVAVQPAITITTGVWHRIIIRSSPIAPQGGAAGIAISVDGSTPTTASSTYNLKNNPGYPLVVGTGDSCTVQNLSDRYMDNLVIWNRALSNEDITDYAALSPLTPYPW